MRAIGRVIAEFLVALLPRRHWARFESVGEPRSTAAAVVTVLIAGGIGVPGFINHATAVTRVNNRVLIDAGARQDPVLTPAGEQVTTATWSQPAA